MAEKDIPLPSMEYMIRLLERLASAANVKDRAAKVQAAKMTIKLIEKRNKHELDMAKHATKPKQSRRDKGRGLSTTDAELDALVQEVSAGRGFRA